MRPEPKKRLPTSGPQDPLSPFSTALDGLSALDSFALPPGPATPEAPGPQWKMGRVVLRRETAHRGGKSVVIIHDFATHLPATVIESLAKKLRAACGCGGTVKGREIEIQGDQAGKIRTLLEKDGFQVAGIR